MSLKHSVSVFRLKRAYKNLDSTEYAANLKKLLGNSRNKSTLTMNDLTSVLRKISEIITEYRKCYNYLYKIKNYVPIVRAFQKS